jgi:hypothetical protein
VSGTPEITPIVERAYILARTGNYRTVTDIRGQLISEGHVERIVRSELGSSAIRHGLMKLCREARRMRPRRREIPE